MRQFTYSTLHPSIYHGHGRQPPFFEGWYFKLVSADEGSRYAIIPGVSLSGDAHAFVQVLDGATGRSAYHVYPLADFWASKTEFEVRIGPNLFTQERMVLDIHRPEGQVQGELRFAGLTPWPVTPISPGIMGWYAWVPRMECYHGVLSLDHGIAGRLRIDGQEISFDRGRGYIEKDWGQSFPAAWVWFQTNHFQQPRTCLTASVAIIPWLGRAFPGFIVGLWREGQLYRFTTYLGAAIERLEIDDDHVAWTLRSRSFNLELLATRAEGGLLAGPTRQDMGKRVDETLNAAVDVRLSSASGAEIFRGRGRHAGLEVHGDLGRLLHMATG